MRNGKIIWVIKGLKLIYELLNWGLGCLIVWFGLFGAYQLSQRMQLNDEQIKHGCIAVITYVFLYLILSGIRHLLSNSLNEQIRPKVIYLSPEDQSITEIKEGQTFKVVKIKSNNKQWGERK